MKRLRLVALCFLACAHRGGPPSAAPRPRPRPPVARSLSTAELARIDGMIAQADYQGALSALPRRTGDCATARRAWTVHLRQGRPMLAARVVARTRPVTVECVALRVEALLAVRGPDAVQAVGEARNVLDRAAARWPGSAEWTWRRARWLVRTRGGAGIEQAVRAVEDALLSHPQDARGWALLGELLDEAGQPGLAAEALRRSLAARPSDTVVLARTHSAMAVALLHQGLPQEATRHVRAALAASPAELRARLALAAVLGAERRRQRAVEELETGLRYWPASRDARRALAEALLLLREDGSPPPDEELRRAEDLARTLVEEDPADARAWCLRARARETATPAADVPTLLQWYRACAAGIGRDLPRSIRDAIDRLQETP